MNLLTPSYLSAPDLIAPTPQRFAWLSRLANSRQGSRVSRSSRDSSSMSEPGRGLLLFSTCAWPRMAWLSLLKVCAASLASSVFVGSCGSDGRAIADIES